MEMPAGRTDKTDPGTKPNIARPHRHNQRRYRKSKDLVAHEIHKARRSSDFGYCLCAPTSEFSVCALLRLHTCRPQPTGPQCCPPAQKTLRNTKALFEKRLQRCRCPSVPFPSRRRAKHSFAQLRPGLTEWEPSGRCNRGVTAPQDRPPTDEGVPGESHEQGKE